MVLNDSLQALGFFLNCKRQEISQEHIMSVGFISFLENKKPMNMFAY